MRGNKWRALGRCGCVCAWSVALALGQEFEISRSTVDGGGAMRSTGGEFELSGTIGQPDKSADIWRKNRS